MEKKSRKETNERTPEEERGKIKMLRDRVQRTVLQKRAESTGDTKGRTEKNERKRGKEGEGKAEARRENTVTTLMDTLKFGTQFPQYKIHISQSISWAECPHSHQMRYVRPLFPSAFNERRYIKAANQGNNNYNNNKFINNCFWESERARERERERERATGNHQVCILHQLWWFNPLYLIAVILYLN